MFDLKVINSVLGQLEEERGIPKDRIIEAIELSLASAYKKEYGKKGQIVKATFDLNTGDVEFEQAKIVKRPEDVQMPDDKPVEEVAEGEISAQIEDAKIKRIEEGAEVDIENIKVRYNPEHHILLDEAKLIKGDAEVDEEIIFPLEKKDDFGRIAAQTAKQVITQKIREAEKVTVLGEFGEREGEIVSGTVERVERGNVFLNMGRAVGILAYDEQIKGEHFGQGERVRAYLFKVEESPRGVFLKLSRSHPKFLEELFKAEVPELTQETVEIKSISREAGSRSKVAVFSDDEHIDPVGALVGQRGVRVSTIMSELGGEKIDIIEWSEEPSRFIEESLSPAVVQDVEINEEEQTAVVQVAGDQQSLAIGKGGQNVRLAAKLTGWKIDIQSDGVMPEGEEEMDVNEDGFEDLESLKEKTEDESTETESEETPEAEESAEEIVEKTPE